jgi:hypothetical protein
LYRNLVPPVRARRSLEVLLLDRQAMRRAKVWMCGCTCPEWSYGQPDWLAVNSVIHFYHRTRINKIGAVLLFGASSESEEI